MKYRIIEEDGQFKVQTLWFWLFWVTETRYEPSCDYGLDSGGKEDIIFPDMEAAEAYIYEKLHRSVQIVRRVYKGSRRLIYQEM